MTQAAESPSPTPASDPEKPAHGRPATTSFIELGFS
jgi:hypothetical protein